MRVQAILNISLVFLFLPLTVVAGSAEDARQILSSSAIEAGLCVHIGSGDGSLTAELHGNGRLLVQGLSTSAQDVLRARTHIRSKGLYGVVTVDKIGSYSPLPYLSNLANLLVVDQDAMKDEAPSSEEILRVLAPNGVAMVKRGGSWQKTVKPMPAKMDDWSHYWHDSEGSSMSKDELVQPPTSLRWIAGYDHVGFMGEDEEYRISGGRVFNVYLSQGLKHFGSTTAKKDKRLWYVARDAFSGVMHWARATGFARPKARAWIASGDRMYSVMDIGPSSYTAINPGGPLEAIDARTGETVLKYDKAGRSDNRVTTLDAVLGGGVLVITARDSVSGVDPETGRVLWVYKENSYPFAFFPRISPDAKQVFFAVGDYAPDWARVVWGGARALVSLDLTTGAVKWRNELFKNDTCGSPKINKNCQGAGHLISQLIYHKGKLGVFASASWAEKESAHVHYQAVLDAKDGKVIWSWDGRDHINDKTGVYRNGPKSPTREAFLDDSLFHIVDRHMLYELDAKNGERRSYFQGIRADGQGCTRATMTPNLILMSSTHYVDRRNKKWINMMQTRGACGSAAYPAYGSVYKNPTGCKCFTMLGGFSALVREEPRPHLPDNERLEKAATVDMGAVAGIRLGVTAFGSSKSFVKGLTALNLAYERPEMNRQEWTDAPVTADWIQNEKYVHETAPVPSGSKSIVAVTHEHRVEARASGKAVWSYTAGGRIRLAPVVHDGAVYFGSQDGWAYCLEAETGKLRWRFRGAPNEQRMVAYGQVESSWPIPNVAIYGGKLFLAAGRHPQLDGGIMIYQLDPATGKLLWKAPVRTNSEWTQWAPDAKVPFPTGVNKSINDGITVDGGVLKFTGFTLDINSGAMTLNGVAYQPQDYRAPEQVVVKILGKAWYEGVYTLGNNTFGMPIRGKARVSLLDLNGRVVRTLFQGIAEQGTTGFDLPRQPNGAYVLRLEVNGKVQRRMPVQF